MKVSGIQRLNRMSAKIVGCILNSLVGWIVEVDVNYEVQLLRVVTQ